MFAINSPSDIYHVLTSNKEATSCGLKVLQAEINLEFAKTFPLHRVSERPSDRSLCQDCFRVEWQKAIF